MKQISLKLSVSESAERLKRSIESKGFTVFADIDHQANAESVGLDLPASRVLIFGNPVAGIKLMQKDIGMSFDLPSSRKIDKRFLSIKRQRTTKPFIR